MQIDTSHYSDTFVAKLSGRMVFSDNNIFRALLDKVATSGMKQVVFDLSQLQSVDSAGLGMFIIAMETAKKHALTLSLKGPTGQVKQLLTLAKFDKLLTITD